MKRRKSLVALLICLVAALFACGIFTLFNKRKGEEVITAEAEAETYYWGYDSNTTTLYISANPIVNAYTESGTFKSDYIGYPGWYPWSSNITTVTFESEIAPQNMYYWFYQCCNLTTFNNLNYLDARRVTTFEDAFHTCRSLVKLDLSTFVTTSVTNIYGMFYGPLQKLEELNLSNFDVSKVTNFSYFLDVPKLKKITISQSIVDYSAKVFNGSGLYSLYYGSSDKAYNPLTDKLPGKGTYYTSKHNWQLDKTIKEATCTEDGLGDFICQDSGCTETTQAVIPALGHKLDKIEAAAATCTTAGTKEHFKCSTCGTLFSDSEGKNECSVADITTAALGHKYGNAVWTWNADGKSATAKITCSVCAAGTADHELSGSVSLGSGITGAVDSTKPATCTQKGTTIYTATITLNGKQYTDSKSVQDVDMLAHSYDTTKWEKDGADHWHKCTVCGATDTKVAHTFTWVIDTPATVTSTGLKHEECVCGTTQNENTVIDILDCAHVNKDHFVAVAATCTTAGNVEYWYCNDCKKNVDSTGNEISNITVAIDTNAHDYATAWSKDNDNHWHECTRDPAHPKDGLAPHDWDNGQVTSQPTTTAKGVKTFTCNTCGQTRTEEFAAGENKITSFNSAGWTYGDTPATHTAAATFGTPTITYSETIDGTYAATKPTKAGTYWVKAEVEADPNGIYPAAVEKKSFTIAKRNITVTINAASSEEGQELEALTATITSGTLAASDSNVYALSTTANKDSINSYPIIGTCLNDNYNITFIEGVYIVSKRAEDPNGGGAIDMPTDANVEFKVTQSKTAGDYSQLDGMSVGYWAQLWNRNEDGTLGDEYTDSLNCVLTLKIPTEIIEAIRGGEEINRDKIADGLGVYYVTDGGLEKVNAFTIAQREDESWIIKFNYNSKFRAEVVFNAENYEEPAEEPAKAGIPWWVWLIVGIGGATLITIIIVAVVLAKKKSANGNAPAPVIMQGKEYDDAELKAQLAKQSKRIEDLENRDDGGFNDVYKGE